MATIDEIVGSIIPNIYIDKITLQGGGDLVFDRNPHIDHEAEPDVVRDGRTGKLKREELRPLLIKKSKSDALLLIDVNLVVKEALEDNVFATWFGQTDFMKYFKVHVIQSTSAAISNKIGRREISVSEAKNLPNVQFKEVLIKDVISKSVLSNYTSTTDDNGNILYDIPFTTRFTYPHQNPQHLAYFAASYLDIQELAKDFELEWDSAKKTLQGRLASEMVINDFGIISQTFLFFDEQGQVYPGEAHQLSDGRWAKGAFVTEEEELLTTKKIYNSKIQDFRNVEALENLNLNLFAYENKALQGLLDKSPNMKIVKNSTIKEDKDSPYFADFCMTRDALNRTRFAFGIHMRKIVRENTIFGEMYKETSALMANTRILSLRVKRIRVKNNAMNTFDPNEKSARFNNEDPPEIVATAGEVAPGRFQKRMTDVGALRELFLKIPAYGAIRYFTGIDKLMEKTTFGIYKYRVSIEIEDNSVVFLQDQFEKLESVIPMLQKYYNDGSMFENYDQELKKFSSEFVKKNLEKWSDEAQAAAPWILPISVYLSALKHFSDVNTVDYESVLLNMIDPKTGSLDGIQTIIHLIDNLASKIQHVIESAGFSKYRVHIPGQTQQSKGRIDSRNPSPRRTIKIQKEFDVFFDSDVPKRVGFDFLDMDELVERRNNEGLNVVTAIEYKERADAETGKYFNATDLGESLRTDKKVYSAADDIDSSKYAFLTPTKAYVGTLSEPTVLKQSGKAGVFSVDGNNELMSSILRLNSLKGSPQVSFGRGFTEVTANGTRTTDMSKSKTSSNILSVVNTFSTTITLPPQEKAPLNDKTTTERDDAKIPVPPMVGNSLAVNQESQIKADIIDNKPASDNSDRTPDATSLMVSLAAPMLNSETMNQLNSNRPSPSALDVKNNISYDARNKYNLGRDDNLLERLTSKAILPDPENSRLPPDVKLSDENIEALTAPTFRQVEADKRLLQKDLPNQVRSLFVASVSPEKVAKDWFADGDPLNDPMHQADFVINHQIINKVEVLRGFFDDNVKKPIWKKLTGEFFNQSFKQNLLCRMTPFEDKELGIVRNGTTDLPYYNEYFVIAPERNYVDPPDGVHDIAPSEEDSGTDGQFNLPPDVVINRITMRLLETHNQNISVATEQYAQAWENIKKATPIAGPDERVQESLETEISVRNSRTIEAVEAKQKLLNETLDRYYGSRSLHVDKNQEEVDEDDFAVDGSAFANKRFGL